MGLWTPPHNWLAGEQASTDELNRISNQFRVLDCDPGAWWDVQTLLNSWVLYTTYGYARYRLKAGMAYIQFMLKNGTTSNGTYLWKWADVNSGEMYYNQMNPDQQHTFQGEENTGPFRWAVNSVGVYIAEQCGGNTWIMGAGWYPARNSSENNT